MNFADLKKVDKTFFKNAIYQSEKKRIFSAKEFWSQCHILAPPSASSSQEHSGAALGVKMLIFHWFYKENVISTNKMLPKPLVLQHLRKKSCCGCSGVGRPTFPLQPQHHFFRKTFKTIDIMIYFFVEITENLIFLV